ncbi:MAG: EAL domain-containing protein [Acidimicrobiales bacterium]
MSTLAILAKSRAEGERRQFAHRRLIFTDAFLGVLIVAYALSMVLRHSLGFEPAIDGWPVDAFEFFTAGLCIARGFVKRPGRTVALLFGAGLLSWCLGDLVLTIESLGGATSPALSVKDVFYLGFYPFTYAAIVVFMRGQVRGLSSASWLDGAVAGLGAAALVAAFAFHSLLHLSRLGTVSTLANVAYPIGDLILFGLVIGATALLPGRRKLPWVLIAAACSVNAIGDTFNLLQSSSVGGYRFAVVANSSAWPIAFVLISTAVWLRPSASNPLITEKPTGFVLPGIGAITGLAILFVGTAYHVGEAALVLALATLLIAGVRLAFSVRGLRELNAERQLQSVTDELTGIGNRRHLTQVLDTFFREATSTPDAKQLAFLFIDLDHFKEINDSFGHGAGDQLLAQLGPRLAGSLRETDLLVRLGGDEFAAILIGADGAFSKAIAHRIVDSLRTPFILDAVPASISASIGIALAPAHATDSVSLLRCADAAMYRAKLNRVPVEIYDVEIDHNGDLLRLVDELRVAVEQNQFELHYQPQLDLHDGSINAVEALIRWPHPRLGYIPPIRFLPLVEDAGMMSALTRLVLDGALAQCAQWRADGQHLAVSVNVSASNLLENGFAELVEELLNHHRLTPEALVLEITETCIISDYERSKEVIEHLRAMGIIVSIDDFGAGFTSLAYLSDLAVSELKLDRSFLSGLSADNPHRDLSLVQSTIELGHALGLRVVAEGIEDSAMLELLTVLGCDIAQGYFISKPKPPTELDLADSRRRFATEAPAAVSERPFAFIEEETRL